MFYVVWLEHSINKSFFARQFLLFRDFSTTKKNLEMNLLKFFLGFWELLLFIDLIQIEEGKFFGKLINRFGRNTEDENRRRNK